MQSIQICRSLKRQSVTDGLLLWMATCRAPNAILNGSEVSIASLAFVRRIGADPTGEQLEHGRLSLKSVTIIRSWAIHDERNRRRSAVASLAAAPVWPRGSGFGARVQWSLRGES
jgi:hypothetical protein